MAKQQQQAKPMPQPAAAKTTTAPAQTLTAGRTATQTSSRPANTSATYKLIPSEEQIRVRAYQKWQAAGCPTCDGAGFWLEAERELREGR
jgi:hypothetical protein